MLVHMVSSTNMEYSYFCSQIVYGFRDVRNAWGDGKTLESDYGPVGIDVYAREINKGYNICPIIGIRCGLADNGTVFIHCERERQMLMEFMEDCKRLYASVGVPENIIRDVVVPAYHLVVCGNWVCGETYRVPPYDYE